MNAKVRRPWPYLSPSCSGWTLLDGISGDIRELVVTRDIPSGSRSDDLPSVQDMLQRLAWLHRRIDHDILGLVTEAHYRDVPWSEIADRLGRSKQSVHQRYSRRVHADATHERLAAELREAIARSRRVVPVRGTRRR